jgi:regulation of enolase protein 1 (concanavalin A-like superfamily)
VSAPILERLEHRLVLASPVLGVGTGLVGNYFSDTQLRQLVLTRTDPTVNFQWGNNAPDPSVPGDQFSVRWTGKVQAQFSENYTFYTYSDEGVSLWVNGQQLIDNWSDHTPAQDSGSIALNAGEVYDIRLEYYDNAFNAECALSWSSASTAKQIIPTSQLYGDAGNISGSWLDRDLGNPGTIGSVSAASGTYNITGGGAGLESSSDQFQYLYQTLNGDGTLVAKVASLTNTGGSARARAGVMVRDSLDDQSTFAGMFIAPDGVKFEYRNAAGADSTSISNSGSTPYWIKLIRDGTLFKGYSSSSGADGTWVLAGTTYVPMDRTVNVGLAVTSGNDATSSKASFTNVSMKAAVPLGAGLDAVRDYSFSQIFTDVARQARAPQTPDFGPSVATDASGWPAADFGQIFISGFVNQAHLYNGTYKLSFTGKATLGTWMTPGGQVQNQSYNAATNTTTADIIVNAAESQDGWYFGMSFTGTQRDPGSAIGSGITNLKLIRPGYDPNNYPTFQPAYLQHLSQLSTLRLMDFTQTNNNTVAEWSDRITPDYARQSTTKGAAWEYAIQLANQLDKDLWINIPSRASDDYVAHLAALLRDNLEPDRVVYVEYSNEVWNGSFSAYTDNMSAAAAEVASGNSVLNADGETNTVYWGWRRTAKRLKEISDIFGSAFGPGSINGRVRAVLAGQFGQPDTIKQGLEFIDRTYGAPSRYFYGVAQAPYFGFANLDDSRNDLSVDEIINAMSGSIDGDTARYYRFNSYATRYGLANMVYEGGPDTFGPNNIAAKQAASLDPRMSDLVVKYLNGWYSQGGGLFEWFQGGPTNWNTQFGTWGLSNALDNLNSPKILGTVLEVTAPRTPLTGGTPVPSTFDARATAGATLPYSNPYQKSGAVGATYDYIVRAPIAGTYQLTLSAATTDASEQLRVNVNSTARTVTLINTGGMTNFGDTPVGNISLAEGINFIRLTSAAQAAGWNLQSLTLAPAAAANQAPMIVNPAGPSSGSIAGKTVGLSVLGADDAGESHLTYSWLAVGETATSVLFTANGSNAAKNTTATFTRSGSYTFVVTVSDGSSTTSSTCSVTVIPTLTSIAVTPSGAAIANGESKQLASVAKDQFNLPLYPQPTGYAWSVDVTGVGGSVNDSGLYTAPTTGLGAATVRAAVNAVSGAATVLTQAGRDPDNPANALAGVDYSYFEGAYSAVPNFDSATPIKSGIGTNFSLAPKNRTDNFGFSFNGYVFVPATGTYTFYTTSDDGSKLFIGGALVVNNDGKHSVQERSGTVILKSGWHAIKVFYFDATGGETLTVSYSGPGIAKQSIPDAALQRVDKPPTVVTAPSASPNPVTGTTAALSVLGGDEAGESALTYTWSTIAVPGGAAAPSFNINGANAAKAVIATFSQAGAYTFDVAISDGVLITHAQLNLTVNQTLAAISVSPQGASVVQGQAQQFAASGLDQFGGIMVSQPVFAWSVTSGGGSIDAAGLYTAPDKISGAATVTASSNSITGSAALTILADGGPTIATPAAATPNPVTGTTANLSVLGSDDAGEAALTYTWAATALPAGAASPVFSVNGTNAAKNTLATFSHDGAYTFSVTISNGTRSVAGACSVTVDQTLTSIIVSPASSAVGNGNTLQFSQVARDQFANAMKIQPAVAWSVASTGSGGSISASGLYTAPSSGTPTDTIRASSGGVSGSATVTVTIASPSSAFNGSADIGSPAIAGSDSFASGVYTLNASGADIFGAADQFHFVYRKLTGDGTIVARVASVQNTDLRAKAGIMLRESLADNSRQVDCFIAPDNSANFQYRLSTGGSSNAAASVAGSAAPYWVKLARAGNVVTGYRSADGVSWSQVGSAVTVNMGSSIYAGLCLTSKNNTKLNTSAFDNVSVSTTLNGPAVVGPITAAPHATDTKGAGSGKGDDRSADLAMDGNVNTFFQSDVASGSWIGLDLGSAKTITEVRFAPRNGFAGRMRGGVFQASNSADFSRGVTNLYTVATSPDSRKLTIRAVDADAPYRYVRYLSPAGSFGDIAELSFLGY